MVPKHHGGDLDGHTDEELAGRDEDWAGFLESLSATTSTRGGFLSNAAKMAAVLGVGGAAAGALARASSASPRAAGPNSYAKGNYASRAQKMGIIEVGFSPFFTQIFQDPMAAYIKAKNIPWSLTFGNENGSIPTGTELYNQYVAANYGMLVLSTGDEMSAWQSTVDKSVAQGVVFINHSTQAVTGATQNTLFSHKQGGIDMGQAVIAWAHKNHITAPVVGLLGNLADPQGNKRTLWAWKTIQAAFPNATLAGSVNAYASASDGETGAANLLAAHPNINVMVSFATIAGVGALTACTHAGKTDRNQFFLGCVDAEDATLKLIADGNSVMQANFGSFFAYSGIMMIRDGIKAHAGKPIYPTRLIYGLTITTPEEAKSFDTIAYDPLNPKYAYIYNKAFHYLDTPVATGQVPPGQ
jgi:ABC-type sugar transport system substrate-binding protein